MTEVYTPDFIDGILDRCSIPEGKRDFFREEFIRLGIEEEGWTNLISNSGMPIDSEADLESILSYLSNGITSRKEEDGLPNDKVAKLLA